MLKSKQNKILLGIMIAVAAIVIVLVVVKKPLNNHYEDLPGIKETPLFESKDMQDIDETILPLYHELLCGSFTSLASNDQESAHFQFQRNGNYRGYTKDNADQLGSWSLESADGVCYVIIKTPESAEYYEVSLNNNNNIVLKANDGTIFSLDPIENNS